ncbi:hypothetical protein Btru_014764 [Bulinus truncatus]|nr:hypothetical protein Btru_014764 [Bulinus truncatus]
MDKGLAENDGRVITTEENKCRKRKGDAALSLNSKVKIIDEETCLEINDKENESPEPSNEERCCQFIFESSNSLRNRHCTKHPEHAPFIPVDEFLFEKLPDPYKDPLFDELIKQLSKLVVRINVRNTSEKRPADFPSGKKLFGTGKICFSQPQRGRHSHFKDKTEWGEIRITTVSHVLFDENEAKRTTVDLFYDGDDSDFKTLPCYKLENSNVNNDRAVFVCITDDMELIQRLKNAIQDYRNVHDVLYNKYKALDNNNLVICVSHPHGRSKHVSFGHYVKKEKLHRAVRPGHSYTRYVYDVPTCSSSSGAPMCIISKQNSWTHHPHSGHSREETYGVSGVDWEKINEFTCSGQRHSYGQDN